MQRRPSNRCMGMVFALIFWLFLLAVVARENNDVNAFEMLPPRSRSESTARLVGFFNAGTYINYHPHQSSNCRMTSNDDVSDSLGGDSNDFERTDVKATRYGRRKRVHPSRAKARSERRRAAAARKKPKPRQRQESTEEDFHLDDNALDDALDDALLKDALLEDAIDSFLLGEKANEYDNSPAPTPGLGPSESVDLALRSLRKEDVLTPYQGAASFLKMCAPLNRGEKWGFGVSDDAFKNCIRGALQPGMLARRLRASPFAGLLDWETLDVTEGLAVPSTARAELGVDTTIAFVSAALYFGKHVEPSIIQFTLRKIGSAWMIDTAVVSKRSWFIGEDNGDDKDTKGAEQEKRS